MPRQCNAKHGVLPQPQRGSVTGVALGFRLFHGCSWFSSMWLTQEKSRLGLDEARYGNWSPGVYA